MKERARRSLALSMYGPVRALSAIAPRFHHLLTPSFFFLLQTHSHELESKPPFSGPVHLNLGLNHLNGGPEPLPDGTHVDL